MAREEFRLCDHYGLIRSYKIETDFVISAKQVEAVLEKLEKKMKEQEILLEHKDKLLSIVNPPRLK